MQNALKKVKTKTDTLGTFYEQFLGQPFLGAFWQ
jgi:hypothetical protein